MWKILCVLVVASVAVVNAQGQFSPQERQQILDYQFTLPRANQLLAANDAMSKYVLSLPDFKERVLKSMKMTSAERQAQMESDPKAMAILKQNGLTAHDYMVGVPALRMALMAAQGLSAPNVVASPANIAFAKANLAELKPKQDAVDRIGTTR